MRILSFVTLVLCLTVFPSCSMLLEGDPTPGPNEDCGSPPSNPRALIAHYANSHYSFVFGPPFSAEEFSITEPTKISIFEVPFGRKVGWKVVVGPENKRFTQFTELNYTRFIIRNDHIISVASQDFAFR